MFAKSKEKSAGTPGFCFAEKTCPAPVESDVLEPQTEVNGRKPEVNILYARTVAK